jgi:hypothetical protein
MRNTASDQQHPTDEVKAQRRQESVGRVERPWADDVAYGWATARRGRGRRSIELESRFVRIRLGGIHKNARAPLAIAPAVMLLTAGVRRCAGVTYMIALARIPRLDRPGCSVCFRTAMRMVPAATEHRV